MMNKINEFMMHHHRLMACFYPWFRLFYPSPSVYVFIYVRSMPDIPFQSLGHAIHFLILQTTLPKERTENFDAVFISDPQETQEKKCLY